jgi:HD-GYP domain-containing protein (c-di-GMP phosphodiesterase class II)
MAEEECHALSIAGVLHDIGKLKIHSHIYDEIDKSLTVEKLRYIRMHAELGYDILIEQGYSEFISESVKYHHENYDGSGYPENLSGDHIPVGARILRVCDVFSALTSDRSYRKAFEPETAVELMIDEVKNFDMKVFLAFLRVIHDNESKKGSL